MQVKDSQANGIKQFEWPLIQLTLWLIIIATGLAIILNFIVDGYNPNSNYIFGIGMASMFLLKYLFSIERLYEKMKAILIFLIWIIFNFSWYMNHGFTRTTIILFAFFFTFIILIQRKKGIIICSILMVLNIIILVFIQIRAPEFLEGTWTEQQDRVDILYTLLIGWAILPAYILIAKTSYVREYRNARKSEELKSSFLANMSHEIRTPLNAITGFSELMMEDCELREDKKYLDIIHSNSLYLNNLIDQVLNISLIESGNIKIRKELFPVKKLVDRLETETAQHLAKLGKQKIRVKTRISDKNLKVNTDRTQLEQVLKNLLTNAVKFTNKGSIELHVTQEQNMIRFMVSDTGKGIEQENLGLIFDRFIKLANQNSKNKGVGLGLYLCKRIVTALGGNISVSSKFGEGTKFEFTIPKE